MQIKTTRSNQGGTMLVTLLMAIIIGVSLASYLTLVSAQNRSVMRSLAWNSCIPVLESGIEEALTQIKYRGITNLWMDGWTLISTTNGPRYFKQRTLGSSYFQVTIAPVEPPVIESTGFELAPLSPAAQWGMILGGILTTDGNGGEVVLYPGTTTVPQYVRRKVRITTRRDRYFNHAMLAKQNIDLNGNRVRTDSFDPNDPLYSTNGKYDPAKARDKGDIATNLGIVGALDTGNADIKGHVSTGPYGSVSIGPGGSVGSKTWVDGGNNGIESGWSSDDMNVDIPPVSLPGLSWTTVLSSSIAVGGTNYNYVLGSGSYRINSLSGKVYVAGNATIYVPYGGSMDFTGNNYIYLAPGATVKLYVGAESAKISGNGVINTGAAVNFQYWGLNTNTKLQFLGNGAFIGSIYAPEAAFELKGSGTTQAIDFTGASVTKTVFMNGNFNFHYDESLARTGPDRGYIVSSWNEINPF